MFRWIFRVMATGPRAGGWQEMQVPATSAKEAEDIVKRSTGATGAKSLGHLGPYVSPNDLRNSADPPRGQIGGFPPGNVNGPQQQRVDPSTFGQRSWEPDMECDNPVDDGENE